MKTWILFFTGLLLFACSYGQKLEKKWSATLGFETPESVLFDPDMEIAFVSNMGKERDKKISDGFISLIDLDGTIENLKWVTGLYDPKGMAIYNNRLYVADINELVVIDLMSASFLKKYPAPNAIFLNDVTVTSDGIVFVSDSRDKRIYAMINEEFQSWLELPELENVNGLWAENGKLYAGNASIWEIDIETKTMTELITDTGGIDGLEKIDNETFIFSNWSGRIFISTGQQVVKLLDTSEEKINTADIDYLPETKTVLVPTFNGHSVDCYRLVTE